MDTAVSNVLKVIPLKELTNGMVLAAPVEDASGRLLLASGETFQIAFISALEKRGIRTVSIEDESDKPENPADYHELEQMLDGAGKAVGPCIEDQLEQMFGPYEGQEPYEMLRPLVEKYLQEGIQDWGEWNDDNITRTGQRRMK